MCVEWTFFVVTMNVRLCAITNHVFKVAVLTLKWFVGYTQWTS